MNKEIDHNSIVRNKSDFIPLKGQSNNLDKFVNAVKSFPVEQVVGDLITGGNTQTKQNGTPVPTSKLTKIISLKKRIMDEQEI